jgi:endonuclease/exonuclease/phosphatase family metal-dependent hydrolase
LKNGHVIRFRRQSGFWRPRWYLPPTPPFQERLGGRIALVTEVDVFGTAFAVYNLHLESRGNDDLRLSQLKEVLEDAARYVPRVPTLLAGDLNFDVSEERAAALIRQTGFRNALGQSHLYTRPARSLFGDPRSIDWAFISGPVKATLGQVHASVNASDHYPISFTLQFS